MTVFAKPSPRYGLEQQVYIMQTALENKLSWLGVVNIYGLLFKNAKNDDLILEAWTGGGVNSREYKEVFNNDKSAAQIGFIEVERDIETKIAIVDVIFTVDLEKIYDQKIRDNEKAYLEAHNALKSINTVIGFERGIEDVFSGYRINNIKYLDMQPFDVFKYRVEMAYNSSTCS